MKLVRKLALLSSVASIALSSSVYAGGKFAIGPKIGTLGVGVDAGYKINDYFNIKADVNWAHYSKTYDSDSLVNYKASLRLLTCGGVLNFHPFMNGFKIAAGVYYNGNKLEISKSPNFNVTLNGVTYTPAQIGSVKSTVSFNKFAPYLGIGYEGAFTPGGNFSYNMDIGVLYQGNRSVKASSDGLLANNVALQNGIKQDIENATDSKYLCYYPVVSFGLKYRF